MLVDSHNHFAWIKRKFLGCCLYDPGICLMRHDPVYIFRGEVGGCQNLMKNTGKIGYGVTKNFPSLHPQFADSARGGRAAINIQ